MMPRSPAKTRSRSICSSDVLRSQRAVIGRPEGHPQGSQGAARKDVIGLEDLRPPRGGERPGFLARSSLVQRGEQHVGCALCEGQHAPVRVGVGMDRAHHPPVGRERDFADALEAPFESCGIEPGFSGRDQNRTFRRIALNEPASILLLQDRIAGTMGDGERALEFARRRRSIGLLPSSDTSPTGAYPVPSNTARPLAVTTSRTVISFLVSVPVLSEAMTVADPSVSTALR